MSKKQDDSPYQLHIELQEWEGKLLDKVTNKTYGAKSLLVRSLLRRFYKEQGLISNLPTSLTDEP